MKKRLFVLLILLLGGVCALLFLTFYRDAKSSAVASLNEQQAIHAKQASRGIEDFFETWTSTLAAFGRLDDVINADSKGKSDIVLLYEAHHEQIRAITRMDERGVIVFTYPFASAEGSDLSGQDHVRTILHDHRPVISEVFRAVQGFDAVALHVPVFKGAEFRGSVAVVIDFESLARRYLDVIRIGKTGYAWVVSRNGTILYAPDRALVGISAFERFAASPSATMMVKQMTLGRAGAASYSVAATGQPSAEAARRYAVFQPVNLGNTFWSIAVASSESELLSSLRSFRDRLALILGLAYLGGMAFSIVGAKAWMIVKEEDNRRRAEQTLRESERRFRTLFESNPNGIFLTDPGTLEIVDCNHAACVMNGYARDELIGRSINVLHPEEIARKLEENIEGGGAFVPTLQEDGVVTVESVRKRKDGSEFPIETSMSLFALGDRVLVMGIDRDISERKKAEDALRASEQKFAKAFHATPDAIVISRLSDGSLLEVNEVFQKESGYAREEVQGRATADLELWAEPGDRERYFATMRQEGRVRDMEARFRMRSGSMRDGLVSGEILEFGGEPCMLTIIRDVTERKRTETELERHRLHLEELVAARTAELAVAKDRAETADRLKSAFLATMSHELRTPLNSIIGFTGILLQGLAGPLNGEQTKQLTMVRESARHLLDLINDVLDISKIEAGQLTVAREPFDLRASIERVVRAVAPLAEKKRLTLATRITPELATAVGDSRRVEQVLINLLSNAIKFTETGSVTLSADVVRDFTPPTSGTEPAVPRVAARIRVDDTGIGIRPEDLPLLFRPFLQIDSGLTRRYEGTGLGLAISRRLADLLGGEITVESRLGAGSTFTFSVPIER